MRMGDGLKQVLIEPRRIQDDFPIVYTADGARGNDEIAGILNIHDDLGAAFRSHVMYRATLLAAFFDEHLKAYLNDGSRVFNDGIRMFAPLSFSHSKK
jgi:hypothetical protein